MERLRQEVAIRNGGGWWDDDSPSSLDLHSRVRGTPCPDEFPLPAEACTALREFCCAHMDELLAFADRAIESLNRTDSAHEDDVQSARDERDGLLSLAGRFGLSIASIEVAVTNPASESRQAQVSMNGDAA